MTGVAQRIVNRNAGFRGFPENSGKAIRYREISLVGCGVRQPNGANAPMKEKETSFEGGKSTP